MLCGKINAVIYFCMSKSSRFQQTDKTNKQTKNYFQEATEQAYVYLGNIHTNQIEQFYITLSKIATKKKKQMKLMNTQTYKQKTKLKKSSMKNALNINHYVNENFFFIEVDRTTHIQYNSNISQQSVQTIQIIVKQREKNKKYCYLYIDS